MSYKSPRNEQPRVFVTTGIIRGWVIARNNCSSRKMIQFAIYRERELYNERTVKLACRFIAENFVCIVADRHSGETQICLFRYRLFPISASIIGVIDADISAYNGLLIGASFPSLGGNYARRARVRAPKISNYRGRCVISASARIPEGYARTTRLCVTRARIAERYGIEERRYRINARIAAASPLYIRFVFQRRHGPASIFETSDFMGRIMNYSIWQIRSTF